jgi:hypothetical protein
MKFVARFNQRAFFRGASHPQANSFAAIMFEITIDFKTVRVNESFFAIEPTLF